MYVKVNMLLIEIRTRPFRNTNHVILQNEKKIIEMMDGALQLNES